MQSIRVGVGGQHNLGVTQIFQTVFDIQHFDDIEKLFVFINHILFLTVNIQRFAAQGENSLGFHIPGTDHTAGSRITLG